MATSSESDPPPTEAPALQWRAWPLVDNFPRSVLFLIVFAGMCALIGWAFEHAGYALLAAVLLGGSCMGYLLPTRYRLDSGRLRC